MPTATCHCGSMRVVVPRKPRAVADCNCSICRRYGVLWAYYKASTVRIEAEAKAKHGYIWGRKALRFVRCATCGCVMYWERVTPDASKKMGVNARNFEPEVLTGIPVRPIDGASG